MKNVVVLLVVLLMISALNADLNYYPKTIVAENMTATWCGYCPQAYQGLEVVHENYNYAEFSSIRYYRSSGDYGTPEIDDAIDFYNVGGYPDTWFNGIENVGGGGDVIETGAPFMVATDKFYFKPAPIKVTLTFFDSINGTIWADVTMIDPDFVLTDATLKYVLVEDEVTDEYTHVTRDIVMETISLTGQNQVYSGQQSFEIDPTWVTENLQVVVFVQDTETEILNSDNSYAKPQYWIRGIVPFEMTNFGPSDELFQGEYFTIYNPGLESDFRVQVVLDEGPEGTSVGFCDENACYFPWHDITLGTDEYHNYHATVDPGGPGMIKYHFEVTSDDAETLIVPFTYISTDTDMIIIDDDGGEMFEDYFTNAVGSNGLSYGTVSRSKGEIPLTLMDNFDNILWNVGWNFPSLDQSDRNFITQWIDAGKNIFVSGQDVGWDLNDSDDNVDVAFYNNYLHANFVSDDANNLDLTGLTGDPIWDGLDLHIAGGDGANNQDYPSKISAYDANTTEILFYGSGGAGAVQAEHPGSGAKIIYFAFGYEAIDNADDRNQVMSNIASWFEISTDSDDNEIINNPFTLAQNYPNPFNPVTTIDFFSNSDEISSATLEIFNVKGQKIKTFTDLSTDNGKGHVIWNGTDNNGKDVTSGIYFYRMDGVKDQITKKMILMK